MRALEIPSMARARSEKTMARAPKKTRAKVGPLELPAGLKLTTVQWGPTVGHTDQLGLVRNLKSPWVQEPREALVPQAGATWGTCRRKYRNMVKIRNAIDGPTT